MQMKKFIKKDKVCSSSDLSWNLGDYRENHREVPERIKANSKKTEGELMSDEEIEKWFLESVETLKVLRGENDEIFKKIHRGFLNDIEYLIKLSRLDNDVLVFAKDLSNLEF